MIVGTMVPTIVPTNMAHPRHTIRKLTKQGKYSYYVTLPKELVKKLHWKERQKLVVRKYGNGILIKDWPQKKKK